MEYQTAFQILLIVLLFKMLFKKNSKAQVWVETAIYTLIGLTIIAIILTTATPQIEKIKDQTVLDHTIIAMNVLDNKLLEIKQAQGSVGKVIFKIAKGRLEIDTVEEEIRYILENSRLELSESGEEIQQGNIILKTEQKGERFDIFLTMKYPRENLTFGGVDEIKTLQAGATSYNILMENIGVNVGEKIQIDFSIV